MHELTFCELFLPKILEGLFEKVDTILRLQRLVMSGSFKEAKGYTLCRERDDEGVWYVLSYNDGDRYYEVLFPENGRLTVDRIKEVYAMHPEDIYTLPLGYVCDPDYCFI